MHQLVHFFNPIDFLIKKRILKITDPTSLY